MRTRLPERTERVRNVFRVFFSTVVSPHLSLQCPEGYQFALFLVTEFIPKNLGVLTGAIVNVNMTSSILAYIGNAPGAGYETTVAYVQNNIPALLKIDYSFAGMTKGFLAGDKDASADLASFKSATTLVHDAEAVQADEVRTAAMHPAQKRRFLSSLLDHLLIPSLEALVGESAPSTETGMEYVAWMEKALRALYPDRSGSS